LRSRTADDLGGRCPRCYLPPTPTCLCDELPRLTPRLQLVIVRHALERKKSTNSARWAALALPRTRVETYGALDAPLDPASLVGPHTWVLYPHGAPTEPPAIPPTRLIVVDGSWTQARRILQKVDALRSLPRLSLPPPPPRPRLRAQLKEEGMSTLEAIAGAYRLLGEPEVAEALETLFTRAVARSEKIRGRRTI
jgi:DTW domain-containing protein YfiP